MIEKLTDPLFEALSDDANLALKRRNTRRSHYASLGASSFPNINENAIRRVKSSDTRSGTPKRVVTPTRRRAPAERRDSYSRTPPRSHPSSRSRSPSKKSFACDNISLSAGTLYDDQTIDNGESLAGATIHYESAKPVSKSKESRRPSTGRPSRLNHTEKHGASPSPSELAQVERDRREKTNARALEACKSEDIHTSRKSRTRSPSKSSRSSGQREQSSINYDKASDNSTKGKSTVSGKSLDQSRKGHSVKTENRSQAHSALSSEDDLAIRRCHTDKPKKTTFVVKPIKKQNCLSRMHKKYLPPKPPKEDGSVTAKSIATKSIATKSIATKSIATKSISTKSISTKSIANKSVSSKSMSNRSVLRKTFGNLRKTMSLGNTTREAQNGDDLEEIDDVIVNCETEPPPACIQDDSQKDSQNDSQNDSQKDSRNDEPSTSSRQLVPRTRSDAGSSSRSQATEKSAMKDLNRTKVHDEDMTLASEDIKAISLEPQVSNKGNHQKYATVFYDEYEGREEEESEEEEEEAEEESMETFDTSTQSYSTYTLEWKIWNVTDAVTKGFFSMFDKPNHTTKEDKTWAARRRENVGSETPATSPSSGLPPKARLTRHSSREARDTVVDKEDASMYDYRDMGADLNLPDVPARSMGSSPNKDFSSDMAKNDLLLQNSASKDTRKITNQPRSPKASTLKSKSFSENYHSRIPSMTDTPFGRTWNDVVDAQQETDPLSYSAPVFPHYSFTREKSAATDDVSSTTQSTISYRDEGTYASGDSFMEVMQCK